MSAFICSSLHTSALAHYAVDYKLTDRAVWDVANDLRLANKFGVNHRYQESTSLDLELASQGACIEACQGHYDWNHVQIYKMARSFAYQCAEYPEWEASPQYALIHAIQEKALLNAWRAQVLASEAYDKAKWTV